MPNRLAGETSPYLLQHAHNPVDWYPWGPDALDRARAENRPIFLSIGYSACHWCHVMERESFENPAIAAQLNRDFIAIKVDREERPDLDDVYMAAVQAMTGSGGWPMSVFLTPDLRPFFGGTYFPPEDRHGLPGFPRLLEAVTDAYRSRPDEVAAQADQLQAHLRNQLDVRPGADEPTVTQLDLAVARLRQAFDPRHGGFGGAPKFPAPMTLEFLLRSWRRTRDPGTLEMVTLTLDRMAAGGINDQLAGGFARYSTDAHWLVPHFEKMLYDNALLAHCYLDAHRATGQERFVHVARTTLDFMLAELQTEEGGFASALDADTDGVEGGFYAWTREAAAAVLRDAGLDAEDAGVALDALGISADGNWEGTNVLHLPGGRAPEATQRGELEAARRALLATRAGRTRPARDDKQLAAWNGMALRAVAVGSLVLREPRYAAATRRGVAFVQGVLVRDGDRLWRTARDGVAHTPGFAEDYANLADGLLAAHAALGEPETLLLAARLMDRAIVDFWDQESGTLRDTGPEHDLLVAQPRSLIDNAVPSANAVAADVLLRLALLTGDEDHDRRARSILRAAAPALDRQPSAFGRMLASADRWLNGPIDAVVAGALGEGATAMREAIAGPYAPDLVIASVQPAADGPAAFPIFAGKLARGGALTAYVCRGYACLEPTDSPQRAAAQVEELVSPPGS